MGLHGFRIIAANSINNLSPDTSVSLESLTSTSLKSLKSPQPLSLGCPSCLGKAVGPSKNHHLPVCPVSPCVKSNFFRKDNFNASNQPITSVNNVARGRLYPLPNIYTQTHTGTHVCMHTCMHHEHRYKAFLCSAFGHAR